MFNNLVLAIPHSVRELKSVWSDDSVQTDADRWTDWFTDRIFNTTIDNVSKVVGTVSRFDCDLERLKNDPLEVNGNGIIYMNAPMGATRSVSKEDKEQLMSVWEGYQQSLLNELTEHSLLIDCHSFPSDVSELDICVGFNSDWSKPSDEVIELIETHFKDFGFSVGINTPYSNSITPIADFEYKSVMIELNKNIYFNEKTLQEHTYSYKVHNLINSLYSKLLTIPS